MAGDEPLQILVKEYTALSSPRASGNGLKGRDCMLAFSPSHLPLHSTDGSSSVPCGEAAEAAACPFQLQVSASHTEDV